MTDTHKSLRACVDAARAQEPPTTGVTAEAVLAGIERQRRRVLARRSVAISAGLAIAASLLAVVSMSTWLAPRGSTSAPVAALEPETATERELPPPQLASAVSLRTSASVQIYGPWSIALGRGVHELEMKPTPGRALRINLPDRELELVEGHAIVHVGEDESIVDLEDGVAAWIGDDGERTLISVHRAEADLDADLDEVTTEPVGARGPRQPTATTLAREAEAHLEAGERDEAIALLRQLVDTGTVTVSNDVVTATPLGRFDLLPDASKTAFLCLARVGAGGKVRESFAAGSGRHPASFRVFEGGMAQKARGGYWTLTAMGEQTAAAVIAAGLCPK